MGIITITITVTNLVDEILAERGFIPNEQVRSITLDNVLVDTGATRLCLPADIINRLGLPLSGEIEVKTAAGVVKARLFKRVTLTVEGRKGEFTCTELPGGQDALLGVIPMEELGLQPDVINQRLILLPETGKNTYHMIL
ncbi:MAG: retroviral-like aspartic protease family protein [Cyanomargarita calcarea GSE-NOS-MK-12-04C]|uniref:Retroviral-like aspartic protease family protein n=1 Tax=Cyanomargarita calcarea GSE-NOS-MK-12-04C TaxID=2839659 RepID=A0A951UQG6_9CYAN|nr:retroviral-like aspartic protease family protein [Cyanomargarita calcarea GSE-NOS-MK-12-04C]